jgi:hypothetical protein
MSADVDAILGQIKEMAEVVPAAAAIVADGFAAIFTALVDNHGFSRDEAIRVLVAYAGSDQPLVTTS